VARQAEPHFLIVDPSGLIRLAGLEPGQLGRTRLLLAQEEGLGPLQQKIWKDLVAKAPTLSLGPDSWPPRPSSWPAAVGSDLALVLFTSGSTGAPKGVMISHQDLYNRVRTEIKAFGIRAGDRLLGLLPFSFDVGLNQLFSSLMGGAKLVLANSWLAKDICAAILEHGVTGFSAVPALWHELLAGDLEELGRCLAQVRYVTVSAGDLSPGQHEALRRLGPRTEIFKTYGQTETFRSTILFPDEYDRKTTSVGRAVEGCQVFIVDSQGRRLDPGQEGQIVHRGDGTMLGYLADPAATRKKLRPNPLQARGTAHPKMVVYTGDQGRLDAEGYLYVLGRRDGMVKIRGNRVYPQEILNQIMAHPEIKEAACLAIRDKTGQSEIIAQVLPRKGASPKVEELRGFLARRLPSYMVPARIELVRSFPRTPSGKIKLAELEAKYRD
jgi:acyl-CoA synthetase (AMP-forming)/AMP-acid ligase II